MRIWQTLNFKFKIIAIMLAVLIMISLTGFYAYRQFSSIVSTITEKSKPDLYLLTAKSLVNNISDAENHVKSYRLTEDTSYIYKFYNSVQKAENKLYRLKDLDENQDHFTEFDSFAGLIEQKFILLDELLHASKLFRVQVALDKAVYHLEHSVTQSTDSSNLNNPGLSFLRKLIQSKKETEVPEATVPVAKVNEQLRQVKQEERSIEEKIKREELRLIEEDLEITLKLKTMIASLEAAELSNLELKKAEADDAMRKTNIQIALFCIAISILLLIMTYIITNYIRHNNRYRKVLRKAKKEAENLAAAKEQFLANVSHEIRTPMHAIAGFTEQLSTTKLDETQKEQIGIMQKSIDHLLYIVNDVLDYSKLQAGKLKLEKIAFMPEELIPEVFALLKPLAGQKHIKLSYSFNSGKDSVIIGDPYRLKQILINLLTNSIKFTSKGSVSLTINAVDAGDQRLFKFEILDTGKGMDTYQITRIFEEFEQADASITRTYGGTGLGLSIVKKLVELQDGKISFESAPEKGTKVDVEIPYLAGNPEDIEQHEIQAGAKLKDYLPEELRILVVDDEEYNRKLISSIFKKHNLVYAEAVNGEIAIEMLKENDYDLILMDTHMPEINGIDATLIIRNMEDSHKSQVPIIALTAAVSEANRKTYKSVGMNGFLPKPFKESELIQSIASVLGYKASGENKAATVKPESKTTLIDFKELKALSNGNAEFYTDMLETFISGSDAGFEKIDSNLKKKNWFWVAEYAHKMCSPCRHLSIHQLYDLLKEIETKARNEEELDSIAELVENAKKEYRKVKVVVEKELSQIA